MEEYLGWIDWPDERATEKAGQALAPLVQAGDVLCLDGDLGAGKTTFTRYFARALGISKKIKSPTFTIVREYQEGRLPLYHMDAYRLEETGSEGLGFEEYLDGDGVCVIEWPVFMKDDLDLDYLWLKIEKTGDHSRRIQLSASGRRGRELGLAFIAGAGGKREGDS